MPFPNQVSYHFHRIYYICHSDCHLRNNNYTNEFLNRYIGHILNLLPEDERNWVLFCFLEL